MCVVMFFRMVTSIMITAIITCREGAMCGSLFSWLSLVSVFFSSPCNCVSAMSHPRSGILLVGTAFLPSLFFPTCSSSYNLQTFSVMGIFLIGFNPC